MASPTDISHPLFARMWTLLLSPGAEHAGAAEHRDELLAGLGGRVIEVGAGNGLNFRHYPAAVTEVVALEPEPYLRDRAEQATAEAPVPVTVVAGVADALPADDDAFDAGVASLVLCSVPDQAAALHELRRRHPARGRAALLRARRRPRPHGRRRAAGPGPVGHLAPRRCRLSPVARHPDGDQGRRIRRRALPALPVRAGPFQIPHVLGSARRPA